MILLIGKNNPLAFSRQSLIGSRDPASAGSVGRITYSKNRSFFYSSLSPSAAPPLAGQVGAGAKKGFTLLELLIVISIIMIVLGFSMPLFRKTFSDIKLSAAVSDIVSLMRYAQERAIVEGVVFRLNFDTGKGEYWLTKVKQEDSKSIVTFENVPGKFGRHLSVSEDLTLGHEASSLDFYPDGEISQGKVTLNNTNKKSSTITVIPNAGNSISIIENAQR